MKNTIQNIFHLLTTDDRADSDRVSILSINVLPSDILLLGIIILISLLLNIIIIG